MVRKAKCGVRGECRSSCRVSQSVVRHTRGVSLPGVYKNSQSGETEEKAAALGVVDNINQAVS